MIRILIVEKDLEMCEEIINNLNKYIGKFTILVIANSKRDIVKIMSNYDVNIILGNSKFKKEIDRYNKPYIIIDNLSVRKISEEIKSKLGINKTNIVKETINSELNFLGYNFKYNGTKYLADAIYYINKSEDKISINLEKKVYPVIADKYSTSSHNIKCNIVNATDNMICECKEEILMKYLGYTEYVKPSPKKVIEEVLNKINNNEFI